MTFARRLAASGVVEVRLSLCVGAEVRMNRVLYISYSLLVTYVVSRL